jgi:prevent-host-death family protein
MKRTVSATQARIHFGELMRQVVESQEPIIVERGGKPHVVVLSVDQYEGSLAGQREQEDWGELVQRAREQIRAELDERQLTPPEEMLRQMGEGRDAQLLALR